MADDDEDMAWRDAVPMVSGPQIGQPMYVTTPEQLVSLQQQMPYHQFHAAAQAQMLQHQMQAQQAMANQAAYNMYIEQGGMFSHGQYWQPGSPFYGSSLGTSDPAHAGWPSRSLTAPTSGLAIIGSFYAPEPIEDAGIRAGEVAGFRAWQIGGRGRTLHSMVNNAEWPPDGIMHGQPGDHDGMGVHAFKTSNEVQYQYSTRDNPIAFGRVALWGSVVEHELGYRAEFAKITAIDEVRGVWLSWTLRRLRRHYGLTGNE